MKPIVICECNRPYITAILKQIRGRFYVVKSYDHLIEVIQTIENQFARLKLNVDDFFITYTSGIDVMDTYGYERCATEVDIECQDGRWILHDVRPCKIPYKPINYRLKPKLAIVGSASL
jgi:hypothetical protein